MYFLTFIKKLLILIILVISNSFLLSQDQGLCEGENATLDCLKKNFKVLYQSNYELFWHIFDDAADRMHDYTTLEDIIDFIELVPIIKGGAHTGEAFGEECEKFLFSNPEIFFDAILSLDDTTKEAVIQYLRYSMTIPKSEMDNFILKYENDKKYNEIFEIYFQFNSSRRPTKDEFVFDQKHVKKITASSVLIEEQRSEDFYSKNNILDRNVNTAWVEGSEGNGIGEWIQFDFDTTYAITGLEILTGYVKSKGIFKANNRVREIELISSDYKGNVLFKDTMDWQYRYIGAMVTNSMRLVIKDVYKGEKYNDTCISEIKIYGIKLVKK